MQSRDEMNNIKQTVPVDLDNANDLVAKIRAASEAGATFHTIGELPKTGENATINGLSYNVKFADYVKGKFTVKLVLRGEAEKKSDWRAAMKKLPSHRTHAGFVVQLPDGRFLRTNKFAEWYENGGRELLAESRNTVSPS